MRPCPVCEVKVSELIFSLGYKAPDGWPLPDRIDWYKCHECGMLYGDGNLTQEMLNDYYQNYYGFGVNSREVIERLEGIADYIRGIYDNDVRVVDFGGAGDDGKSILVEKMKRSGISHAYNVNAGEPVPDCDVLLASHVLEHVYDMPEAMEKITKALVKDGLLIVDGPDATGISMIYKMPMLDFHTKHINHFRLIDYLRLMERYGFELVDSIRYVDVRSRQSAACLRLYFKRYDTARVSAKYIQDNMNTKLGKLREIKQPVNVWGLGDIAWHLLSQVELNVVDYIDMDPAMQGETYAGKLIKRTVENDEPILIIAQGQQKGILDHIKLSGLKNKVIIC